MKEILNDGRFGTIEERKRSRNHQFSKAESLFVEEKIRGNGLKLMFFAFVIKLFSYA